MTETAILVKGVIIGFSVSIPVGPVGLLCIQRTLSRGRITGLVSGLGAATADFLYSLIAGFGITYVSGFLINQSNWISFLGGILLLLLGLRTYSAEPIHPKKQGVQENRSLVKAFFSTFLLTISNPLTILLFMGIFASLSSSYSPDSSVDSIVLVTGVLMGASAWWLSLSTGVSKFRHKFRLDWIHWINKATGAIIFVIGIFLVIDSFLGPTDVLAMIPDAGILP